MRYRPRWARLGFGALIVVILFTYPLWRGLFSGQGQQVPFALAEPAQRSVFGRMADQGMAATAYAYSLTVVPVPTEQQPPVVPPDADVSLSGEFRELDAVHRARGTVTFYRLIDDTVILRFDDFEITNAPGLTVYLSASEDPRTFDDITTGVVDYFEVGSLRGTTGTQQYNIPGELSLAGYRTVVIASEPLQTVYSSALIR